MKTWQLIILCIVLAIASSNFVPQEYDYEPDCPHLERIEGE